MKKILLLCIIVMYCMSGYAITLTASPGSVVSPPPGGGIYYVAFTVNASGETSTSHITSLSYTTHANSPSPSTAQFDGNIASAAYYGVGAGATNFSFHLTMASQSISTTYVVTYYIQMVTSDHSQSFATFNITVTSSGIFYNVLECGNFTKNTCGSTYYGSVVNYCVPINTYTSTIDQSHADAPAIAYVAAHGQAYANTNGSCIPCAYTVNNIYIDAHPPYLALNSNTGVTIGGSDHTVYFTFNGPATTTFTISASPTNNHDIFLDPSDPPVDNHDGTTTVSNDFYVITTNGATVIPITLKLTDVCGNVDSYVINVHYIP